MIGVLVAIAILIISVVILFGTVFLINYSFKNVKCV